MALIMKVFYSNFLGIILINCIVLVETLEYFTTMIDNHEEIQEKSNAIANVKYLDNVIREPIDIAENKKLSAQAFDLAKQLMKINIDEEMILTFDELAKSETNESERTKLMKYLISQTALNEFETNSRELAVNDELSLTCDDFLQIPKMIILSIIECTNWKMQLEKIRKGFEVFPRNNFAVTKQQLVDVKNHYRSKLGNLFDEPRSISKLKSFLATSSIEKPKHTNNVYTLWSELVTFYNNLGTFLYSATLPSSQLCVRRCEKLKDGGARITLEHPIYIICNIMIVNALATNGKQRFKVYRPINTDQIRDKLDKYLTESEKYFLKLIGVSKTAENYMEHPLFENNHMSSEDVSNNFVTITDFFKLDDVSQLYISDSNDLPPVDITPKFDKSGKHESTTKLIRTFTSNMLSFKANSFYP